MDNRARRSGVWCLALSLSVGLAFSAQDGRAKSGPRADSLIDRFVSRYEVVRCLFAEGRLVLRQLETKKLVVLRTGDALPDGQLRVQRIAAAQVILENAPAEGGASSSSPTKPQSLLFIEKSQQGRFLVREASALPGGEARPLPSNEPTSISGGTIERHQGSSADQQPSTQENKTGQGVGK